MEEGQPRQLTTLHDFHVFPFPVNQIVSQTRLLTLFVLSTLGEKAKMRRSGYRAREVSSSHSSTSSSSACPPAEDLGAEKRADSIAA